MLCRIKLTSRNNAFIWEAPISISKWLLNSLLIQSKSWNSQTEIPVISLQRYLLSRWQRSLRLRVYVSMYLLKIMYTHTHTQTPTQLACYKFYITSLILQRPSSLILYCIINTVLYYSHFMLQQLLFLTSSSFHPLYLFYLAKIESKKWGEYREYCAGHHGHFNTLQQVTGLDSMNYWHYLPKSSL